MSNSNWLLPDYLHDILPPEAARLEALRSSVLELFCRSGYELVIPPMLEFTESLFCGKSPQLEAKTFKVVDQLSGRTMGLRADMTAQVTRIDAHLLNRTGVVRLCYCGPVLQTHPGTHTDERELLQIGAEIYGYSGYEADLQIIRLAMDTLRICGVKQPRLDLNHPAITRALISQHSALQTNEQEIITCLKQKDLPALAELLAELDDTIPGEITQALLDLPGMYGSVDVISQARQQLPQLPEIHKALDDLQTVADCFDNVSVDLADVSGLNFHSGIRFAIYALGWPEILLRGGRYDDMSLSFGRSRPATGFSLDLRKVLKQMPKAEPHRAILAPCDSDPALAVEIARLREEGEIVVESLPGAELSSALKFDRELYAHGASWLVRNRSHKA